MEVFVAMIDHIDQGVGEIVKTSPVSADQDGVVFLVRAVPSVNEEDSLGGILPITNSGEVTIS